MVRQEAFEGVPDTGEPGQADTDSGIGRVYSGAEVCASGGMTPGEVNGELGCGKGERLLDSRMRGNDGGVAGERVRKIGESEICALGAARMIRKEQD